MAGRKTFTAGEVLQAADVNDFLMDQSVMVFAGTAARGSAIPSPTEGMVTYLEDADELQVYTTDWGAISNAKILQVVQTAKTDAYTLSLAQAAEGADVTGLTVSITPSSTSSKILVLGSFTLGRIAGVTLYRDGTATAYIGDASSSESRASTSSGEYGGSVTYGRGTDSVNIIYLDSPATTSSITYSIRLRNLSTGTATVLLNRSNDSSGDERQVRTASSITVMEVAG